MIKKKMRDVMKNLDKLNLGIYEKALPKDIDWVKE